MNAAEIHLMVNHFPIIGVIIGIFTYGHGLYYKSLPIQKTALTIFALAGVFAIVAYLSGEDAEKILINNALAERDIIHEHEELAEKVIWIILALSSLAFVTLYFELTKKPIRILQITTLLLSIMAGAALYQVANSGGKIMHPELRSDFEKKEILKAN